MTFTPEQLAILNESNRLLDRSVTQLEAGNRLLAASQAHASAVDQVFQAGGGPNVPWEPWQSAFGIAPAPQGSGMAFVPVQPHISGPLFTPSTAPTPTFSTATTAPAMDWTLPLLAIVVLLVLLVVVKRP